MLLKGKTAIITGGSRGIGRAIAQMFARNGASLLLVAMHEDRLTKIRTELAEYDTAVEILAGDVADEGFARLTAQHAEEKLGPVDILVNCAGMITRTPFEDLGAEEWQRVLNVNLNGAYYMCKEMLPGMRKRRYGKIINITSQMARMPHPNASPSYEVSKAGLAALTRHLAYHYAKHNICVNAIAPGSIDTDLPKSMAEEVRIKLKAAAPLGRLGEPEEVSELALFLASDKSNYITGATINISGGSLMD